MARTPNYFLDPLTSETYAWPINHDEEDEGGKTRNIEHTGNTAQTGLVRQQSDPDPIVLKLRGAMNTHAQVRKTIQFFNKCEDRTIFFTDFAGDVYEVIILAFRPKRQRTVRNSHDLANAPDHFWKYDLEMEVVRSIDSIWDGAAP